MLTQIETAAVSAAAVGVVLYLLSLLIVATGDAQMQ